MANAETSTAAQGRNAGRLPCCRLCRAWSSGGVERGTVEIAAALTAGGWKSVVASAGGPMVREIERAGAPSM